MSCPFMHTHIPTFHVCVRVCVRTCVRGFVFVNNSGLLPVTLAFLDPIPSENTVKTFMGMYACIRPCACACVRVFTRRARKYVHVHDEIILLWRLSTPVLLCVRHIIAYRTLDRKCIYLQISISIVMSLFRKQSTQTCTNGFSNIGQFCKIVTLLMNE